MGFFDTILGMFGIGQPKLTMQSAVTTIGPGGIIDATLTLTGGSRPLPLTALSLCLRQSHQSKNAEGVSQTQFKTLGEVIVPQGGRMITPGESFSLTLRMQVPTDSAATDGAITYKLTAGADVPGLDASATQPVTVTSTPDAWAAEDLRQYHVVAEEIHGRHSSVKGDFRIVRLTDGFVVSWKNELSAREFDGTVRWRVSGWGRSLTVSPDGTQLLVSNDDKQLAVLNAADGALVSGPNQLAKWPGDLAWLPGGAFVVGTDDGISTMQTNFFPIGLSFGGDTYIGGVAASTEKRYFASYPNSNSLRCSEVPTGDHGHLELQGAGDIFPGKDGTWMTVRGNNEFHVVQADPLKWYRTIAVPGVKGTRFLGQAEYSHTNFATMPRFADDNQRILVQDGSGQLWLVNKDGDQLYVWPREIVDRVEDTCWIGPDDFVAITNDGRVMRLSAKGGKASWVQQDA